MVINNINIVFCSSWRFGQSKIGLDGSYMTIYDVLGNPERYDNRFDLFIILCISYHNLVKVRYSLKKHQKPKTKIICFAWYHRQLIWNETIIWTISRNYIILRLRFSKTHNYMYNTYVFIILKKKKNQFFHVLYENSSF